MMDASSGHGNGNGDAQGRAAGASLRKNIIVIGASAGGVQTLTDLLGGRIDYMFLPVHVALQHIQAGKLKAIATGSAQRLAQLPDVPTLKEAGITSDSVDMWYGVLAPKGTPSDVVERLGKEIAAVLEMPSVAKAFEAQGMVPATSSAEAFGSLIARDAQRWAEVVKRGGITAD